MSNQIYLDYAAATPIDPRVLKAMEPFFSKNFYNPSANYLAGRGAKDELENARGRIAKQLGAKNGEIFFTGGATEANNLAISGMLSQFPEGELLVSSIEHESVLAPARKFNHKEVPVDSAGIVDLKALQNSLSDQTVLVSIMMVNNELGSLQPLREVSQLLSSLRVQRLKQGNKLPIYLHTDAVQAINFFDAHVARLGVDLMTVGGGKIYGPKQTGILFVKSGLELQPIILGGGQEHGLRSGTENVAGAAGLAEAIRISQESISEEAARINELRKLFIEELNQHFPSAVINGSTKRFSPHILHVSFPGYDNERLMMEMDQAGVLVAVGSACSASSEKPSHVLTSIGLTDEIARSSLRFSFGRPTTKNDIQKTINLMQQLFSHNR